jgi:calcium-dependent protein kinase
MKRLYSPPVGKGAQGEVRKALHFRTKEIRAIKIIDKAEIGKENWKYIVSEIEILRTIDHPNIVKIYEFFESLTHFYIVMEFCPGKLLFQKFDEKKYVDEKEAANIMFQVLAALRYLHTHEVVHMDLKSENIIYNGKTIKLIDFGMSQTFTGTKKMTNMRGTKYYLAPEVIRKTYNYKCDIWSAGILLFMLVTGKTPFKGKSEVELFDNIKNSKYATNLNNFPKLSTNVKELIGLMLTPNPSIRPETSVLMEHPWFEKIKKIQNDKSSIELLKNIKNFKFHNKLQRGIFYYFINNLITSEEHEKLTKAFKMMDKDNDGELSKKEFVNGLKALEKSVSQKDIVSKFEMVDTDRSGSISYMEFVAAAFTKEEFLNGKRLHKLFKVIDIDNNNKISMQEFMVLFKNSNYITEEELKEIIKKTDLDPEGEIDFNQFKHFMRNMMTDFEFSSKQQNYEEKDLTRKSRVHSMFSQQKIFERKSSDKSISNDSLFKTNKKRKSEKIRVSKIAKSQFTMPRKKKARASGSRRRNSTQISKKKSN